MNQGGWISVAVGLGFAVFWYLAAEQLKLRLAGLCLGWLRPLTDKIFPAFKLEPWLFEPIAEDNLPAWQKLFFETHTPGFLVRRFTHLGDFVLRRDPKPSCSRYFLSPDGTVIGGLTCYLDDKTIDCMSVLLDGTYLETANIRCSQLPPKEHGLQFFVTTTNDTGELIEHHLASTAKAAAAAKSQLATLTASDLTAVSNYGRQLAMRSLQKQRVLVELPEFLREKMPTAEAT